MKEVRGSESLLCPDFRVLEAPAISFAVTSASGPTAEYRGLTLHSVFQPIGSFVHGKVVGYEALLRAIDRRGQAMAPQAVFAQAQTTSELAILNRIVTELHFKSFCAQDPGNCWLFINISTLAFCPLVTHPGSLFELSAKYGIAPSRIVIELLEHDILDREGFGRCLSRCRDAGFMVAMDDFGKGWSNLDRILNFVPSIVKFDQSLVFQGRSNLQIQHAYRHLTSMLHEVGIMVLAEGIESVEDASFMVDAGVDFFQGYWLAQPDRSTVAACVSERNNELRAHYIEQAGRTDQEEGHVRVVVEAALGQAAAQFAATGDIARVAKIFQAVPGARRLVVLDENGFDVGVETAPNAAHDVKREAQLAPLQPDRSARFTHRRYFRDALRWPNQVHFASPVYSLVDGTSSNVAAKAVSHGGRLYVLCGVFLKP